MPLIIVKIPRRKIIEPMLPKQKEEEVHII
jgi:hypothetical protein